jgi:hypothetical protein
MDQVMALALLGWVSGRGLVEEASVLQGLVRQELVQQGLVQQGLAPHSLLRLDRLAYTCQTSNCTSRSSHCSGDGVE